MTVHTCYHDDGTPYDFDDDPLVLPDGATEADYVRAWEVQAHAAAFWMLYPEL